MVSSYAGTTDWDGARARAFEVVQNQFGSLPYNCQTLDKDLKRIQEAIIKGYRMPLSFDRQGNANLNQRAYKEALESKKASLESAFQTRGCRDIIENIRLTTVGLKETEYAIKSEQQVLGKSNKDQNIYIGIGAVVMLVGLYVILQK
jgi:hypothetical protein